MLEWIKRLMFLVVILNWLGLSGCAIILKEKGETGIKVSHVLSFYHETSETKATSESRTDAKSLVDHIGDLRNSEPDGD